MTADVFLYGRTVTYDYFDMYLPEWLEQDSDGYREYRRTVTHIMKIRDILKENEMSILKETGDSIIFYRGTVISMLCRFCHITGTDQFGRPICSTEGFIFRNDSLNDMWKHIPDMTALLAEADSTFYNRYIRDHGDETKPVRESLTQETVQLSGYPELRQFEKLKEAVQGCSRPFSFAYGRFEKKLYSYAPDNPANRTDVFFVSDECTFIPPDEVPAESTDNTDGLEFYAEISKSSRERIRYRVVLCDSSGKVRYESYEKEAGAEIRISEIFRMAETVREYIAKHGKDENTTKKCVPFNSDSDYIYPGREAVIEYRPPAERKRSIMQIIKGVKQPDYSVYLFLRTAEKEEKLSEKCSITASSDDSEARLVSWSELMEAVS